MRRGSAARGVAVVMLLAVVIFAAVGACGTTNSPACYAGDLLTCACESGALGTQACDGTGSYGPCTCADAGGSSSGAADTGKPESAADAPMGDGATNLPYMATCYVVGNPGDCSPMDMDQCFDFPNRGKFCTHPCTSPTQCALPSTGCNGMGVCKAPNAEPGAPDAGG
jgi:hypothetical protein